MLINIQQNSIIMIVIGNDFDKAFTSFNNKIMGKEDFEILSEMNEITQQSESFASAHCCAKINLK